jgi:prephenate dehydratase
VRLSPGYERVAFQGEAGAFSEEAAVRLLGDSIVTVPRPTFDTTFYALATGAAHVLVVPIENSLAGSVLHVYDLLLTHGLWIAAEIVIPIEHYLIGCPGASIEKIRSVESHPMALAQCERLFTSHPEWKRVAAEDTAGSAREVVRRGDGTCAAIAGRRAAERYGGAILAESVQDNAQNFTRFVLLLPGREAAGLVLAANDCVAADKMTLAIRLAHRPGALLAALAPFAAQGVNLSKIESRPIHGCPWEYQFFVDVAASSPERLDRTLGEIRAVTEEVRVLGLYPTAVAGSEAESRSVKENRS